MLKTPRITKALREQIEKILDDCGLFYRVFSRDKKYLSLQNKISLKGYERGGKLLQDSIGIRIVFYFLDDVQLFIPALKNHFTLAPNGESIDIPPVDKFSATRINLVFRLPDEHIDEFNVTYKEHPVDSTFEVQIRTIFSEGWHEVDHDLRYKRKSVWENNTDLSRVLNGIIGNLESCDWSILQLFSELSYRCYKCKNWDDMIRNKYRIRFGGGDLHSSLVQYMNANLSFSKLIYRADRDYLVQTLLSSEINFPKTVTNLVYFSNFLTIRSKEILDLTPNFFLDQWNSTPALDHYK